MSASGTLSRMPCRNLKNAYGFTALKVRDGRALRRELYHSAKEAASLCQLCAELVKYVGALTPPGLRSLFLESRIQGDPEGWERVGGRASEDIKPSSEDRQALCLWGDSTRKGGTSFSAMESIAIARQNLRHKPFFAAQLDSSSRQANHSLLSGWRAALPAFSFDASEGKNSITSPPDRVTGINCAM